jgi:sec-independent protein translocase protein TatA
MFGNLNPMELMVVVGVAVLLFGKRLPEVGRTLGKGIVEFKKGLNGITEELDFGSTLTSTSPRRSSHTYDDDRPRSSSSSYLDSETAVPKFEPPVAPPVASATPVDASPRD